MDLASLIFSVMAFILSTASIIWHISQAMSTHKIQMVPMDDPLAKWNPLGRKDDGKKPDPATGKVGKKIGSDMLDFESFNFLSEEEKSEVLSRISRPRTNLNKDQK